MYRALRDSSHGHHAVIGVTLLDGVECSNILEVVVPSVEDRCRSAHVPNLVTVPDEIHATREEPTRNHKHISLLATNISTNIHNNHSVTHYDVGILFCIQNLLNLIK